MIPLSLRFAAREMRAGVRGFRIFLACLAVGVAAIAAASSTAEAFRRGLAQEARTILGGDLAVSVDRGFTPTERAAFGRAGRVTYAVATRAMAQAPSGDRRLVELRGVDGAYPLAGTVDLSDAAGRPVTLAAVFAGRDGLPGAAVEQALLDRLHLKLGQPFKVGNEPMVATAVLGGEPDRMSRGFALGPRVLTAWPTVEKGGFLQGSLFGETARIALPDGADPKAAARALTRALPQSLRLRDRYDATPGIRRLIDRLEYFLGFIGLASLVAGGLGVSQAVGAYLEGKKPSIAALKALGADGPLIRNLYLIQIAALALLGIAIGLGLGAACPFLLAFIAGNKLPVPALFAVYPGPLLKAALFGGLSAGAFCLLPLARARLTPPAALFRHDLSGRLGFGLELVGAVACAAGLAAVAVMTAPSKTMAGIMIAGVAVSFALLWGLGRAGAWLAGRGRRLARGATRLGLANLAGPGSAARTASPAVGLGVALLAAVVLIQSSLLAEVREVAPRTAPSLVFTEIPAGSGPRFDAEVAAALGPLTPDTYLRMPMFSGRITAVKGKPVQRRRGERFDVDLQMSVAGAPPKGLDVVSGAWWPAAYAGPPLVSISEGMAESGALKIGDAMTINALGTDIQAKVASVRRVDVGAFGPSFQVILDQHALAGAGLRQIAIAKTDKAGEERVLRRLGTSFPQVDVISVREQLEAATDLFDRLALAVRGAAGVAALAGVLVLAGAIAAGARARAREAALFKVLGAARGQVLMAYAVEYGAVGLIAGAAGVALGAAAAWPVVVKVFEASWSVDWAGVAALAGGAMALAGLGGVLAALVALGKRPAPVLRAAE
ncbi:MAG TPA: FtsX-like permease family protein [Caulobacteraceae bacterium]